MSKVPVLVVRNVLVNEDNSVLLGLRKDTSLWELPGGKVGDESVRAAAVREQEEETGIILRGLPHILTYIDGRGAKSQKRTVELILGWDEWSEPKELNIDESHEKWAYLQKHELPIQLTPNARLFFAQFDWSRRRSSLIVEAQAVS